MADVNASLVDGIALGPARPPGARGRRPEERPPQTLGSPPSGPAPEPSAPASQPADHTATWRRAGLLFALGFAALIAIYIDTVIDLWDGWGRTGTFAHGYIVFPVSAWLVWRLRHRLVTSAPRAQPLALVPLAACGLMWLAGRSAGVHTVEQYAFVAMVPCLAWGVLGTDVARRILYPLAFLFFAVPAGDFLMPTLMNHTADFTVTALRLSGVPVFREGNFFSIPSGNWSVVEACSGLRYLIASVTLGVLFAYLNYRGAWRRAAFIVASMLVPILANWLRAYMIVMIAHLSSNKLATGVDHLVYGWLFFGIVMMALFWFGNLWRDDDADDLAAPAATVLPSAPRVPPVGRTRSIALVTAAVVAVAAPWPAVASWLERQADAVHPGAIGIDRVDGWQPSDQAFSRFVPHYLYARSTGQKTFVSGDRKVALFVGYYSGQASSGSMVTYDNDVVIVADKVWGTLARRGRVVSAGGPLDVVESEIRSNAATGEERLLTWRWYWINGRLTTNDYLAKAYTALDKLTGRGDDSAVIVVSAPLVPGGPDAAAALEAFVSAAQRQIVARLATLREEARR